MPLEKTRLFVLGAGFSAAGNIPMIDSLLGHAIGIMKDECPGIYSRIENTARTCFSNDLPLSHQDLSAWAFTKLCSFLHYLEMRNHGGPERWSMAGDREILTLKYFISKAISQLTPRQVPNLYIEFARQLDCYDLVVTFNWDCLLEKALIAAGKNYTYDPANIDWRDPTKRNIVRLCKMHGSINWTASNGIEPDSRIYSPMQFPTTPDMVKIYFSDFLINSSWIYHNWLIPERRGQHFSVQPFLILPGVGKAFDVRKLGYLWYQPSAAFDCNRDCYIIGLSLSKDDFFIRFLLQESLPFDEWENISRQITIINPSSKDISTYKLIGLSDANIRQKRLDRDDIAYISSMRERP